MSLTITSKVTDVDKHELDVNDLLYHNGKLYSASDDGKIKIWTSDLKLLAETQAHPCSVYCLTASEKKLYSCSNEGTIKTWESDSLKAIKTIHKDPDVEFWKIQYSAGCLFSGDHNGSIRVYKKDKYYGAFNLAEPVKDMVLDGTIMFTSNILDLVITQVMVKSKHIQFGTKGVIEGKTPIALVGDKLCFTSRNCKDIVVHENSVETAYKFVAVAKDVSEMIINSLAGAIWNGNTVLFSGGWDKILKKWKIEDNELKAEGSCDVGFIINTLTVGEEGQLFVGGENGHLIRVDTK